VHFSESYYLGDTNFSEIAKVTAVSSSLYSSRRWDRRVVAIMSPGEMKTLSLEGRRSCVYIYLCDRFKFWAVCRAVFRLQRAVANEIDKNEYDPVGTKMVICRSH
jgi:hypothetical protein